MPNLQSLQSLLGKITGDSINELTGLKAALKSNQPIGTKYFWEKLLPFILKEAAKPTETLDILEAGTTKRIEVRASDCLIWLARMFIGGIPMMENHTRPGHRLDMLYLLQSNEPRCQAKLQCFLAYFQNMLQMETGGRPSNLPPLWIQRIFLPALASDASEWQNLCCSLKLISAQPHESPEAFMTTNSDGYLVADFANCYIGGSTLEKSAVQEEIHFSEHPTCTLATLTNTRVRDNEAIQIGHSTRHAITKGYHRKLTFKTRVKPDVAAPTITAMDAKDYIHREPRLTQGQAFLAQLQSEHINRDINKARAAFCNHEIHKVATGNWGCGAFGGDPVIKFIIQVIAATLAGKEELRYHSFGDNRVNTDFCNNFATQTRGLTAAQMHQALHSAAEKLLSDAPTDTADIEADALREKFIPLYFDELRHALPLPHRQGFFSQQQKQNIKPPKGPRP